MAKRKKTSAELLRVVRLATSSRDLYDIAKLQTFLALRGDTAAANFIYDRTIGRPSSVAEMMMLEAAMEREARIDTEETQAMVADQMRQMWGSIPSKPLALESPEAAENEGSDYLP